MVSLSKFCDYKEVLPLESWEHDLLLSLSIELNDYFLVPNHMRLTLKLITWLFQCTEGDSYFSFLPLAHVYDQIMESYCIYKGSSIGFWRGVSNNSNLLQWFLFLTLICFIQKFSWCITNLFSMWFFTLNLKDIRFLMEDLQELRPTMFCGVPRVYDRIYTGNACIILNYIDICPWILLF